MFKLQLVTNRNLIKRSLMAILAEALAGGLEAVQLREKDLLARDLYQLAQEISLLTEQWRVPLIVNDRVDVALAVKAAGVHLGQQGLPVALARRLMGKQAIIGVSTHNVAEAVKAARDGADYINVGHIFPTDCKPGLPARGTALLTAVKEAVNIPVLALGGINLNNVEEALCAGADGIAVMSAILTSATVAQTVQRFKGLVTAWERAGT